MPLRQVTALTVAPLGTRLEEIHDCIRRHCPGVDRLAVALYDPSSDRLRTFVHSTDSGSPLTHYDACLADVPSLRDLADGHDRVIDDLSVFADSPHEHTQRLLAKGYRSSYALPLHDREKLWGIVFLDSKELAYFAPAVTERLEAFAPIVASVLTQSLIPIRLLRAALRVTSRLTHFRDPETRTHLERMSRYTRLIARGLAARAGLSDEFLEFLFLFAPVHDVGKVAVPDSILLKDGRLTPDEFRVMQSHVTRGVEIVDAIVEELGLAALPHIEVLRNVVLCHHEAVDGSGYPAGLNGDAIPLEARIVAVADVFDALTSRRCYKRAWRTDEALAYLQETKRAQFDESCVAMLQVHSSEVDAIRLLFPDEETDPYQSREGYDLDL